MHILQFVAILAIGGILGGLLGYFGKCSTGACPLTATPWRGATFGTVVAALFGASLLLQRPVTGRDVGSDRGAAAPQAGAGVVVAKAKAGVVQKESAAKPVHIKGPAQFEKEVLKDKGLCLVDFYADWCPPCRKLAPIIEKLAGDLAGKVKFVKVNVDQNEDLAREYRVSSIPRLIIFKAGKTVDSDVGFKSEESLRKWLGKYMKK
ncbi:MAG: thioredoxin [Kiritimatiellaeota bacterium]|nr:thioredoxin [Kiritimatiellota bacterium]